MSIDLVRVRSQRKALKRDLLIYTGCFLSVIPLIFIGSAVTGPGGQAVFGIIASVIGLTFLVEAIIILFRIRFMCLAMGKSVLKATLYQLGVLFTPLPGIGIFIFSLIILNQSGKLLQVQ